ncbi:CPBP family intramembrane metalloprotease [Pseudoclavibacter chungangensis]|uniref:CPBP family intramembrane metalloprotease n=1 Tax=Pseudoclavibacter chungangensis TaxID=587635 RepID=A0A7J5BMF3_9MICO|nr:type II CAAX endopeptidase family protein [Pseudoclavibacter chungangensis]KAB1652514.1 CPBP family intramembrane metalloprotease [Pseudoclavibacter chungangensis]
MRGPSRRRRVAEVWIVLALAILPSTAYALVQLADRLTRSEPLAAQTTTLNPARDDRALVDSLYQLIGIAADLVPVALVVWLLWEPARSGWRRLGLDVTRPGRDIGGGLLLAACIGVPGLGLYLLTRAVGITPAIAANGQDITWWSVVLLVLAALRAALLEEVVVVGYLQTRLRELGWSPWGRIVTAAVLRGSYHLYQGAGMALGNVVMGLVFGWWYERHGRTAPLVVAHFVLDLVSFLGYAWAVAAFPHLFGASVTS